MSNKEIIDLVKNLTEFTGSTNYQNHLTLCKIIHKNLEEKYGIKIDSEEPYKDTRGYYLSTGK